MIFHSFAEGKIEIIQWHSFVNKFRVLISYPLPDSLSDVAAVERKNHLPNPEQSEWKILFLQYQLAAIVVVDEFGVVIGVTAVGAVIYNKLRLVVEFVTRLS